MTKKTGNLVLTIKKDQIVKIDGPIELKIVKMGTSKAVVIFNGKGTNVKPIRESKDLEGQCADNN